MSKAVVLSGQREAEQAANWSGHHVLHPERAGARFASECWSTGLKRLRLFAIGALAWIAGAWIMSWVGSHLPERLLPNNFFGLILGLIGVACLVALSMAFLLTPVLLLHPLVQALGAVAHALIPPRTRTPKETIGTFFTSIRLNLWNRAYNCPTDEAQQPKPVGLDLAGGLLPKQMIASAAFNSVESFRDYWSSARLFSAFEDRFLGWSGKSWFVPKLSKVLIEQVDDPTAKVVVPVKVARPGMKDNLVRYEMNWHFVLVRRGGHWFLGNGYVIPLKAEEKSSSTTGAVSSAG